MTNIQFKWRGSVYECTEQWNKDFKIQPTASNIVKILKGGS